MEFIEQIAPEIKLTPEQVTVIKEKGNEYLNQQKGNWEKEIEPKYRKMANDNAENILNDVARGFQSITGVERIPGVKLADYLKESGELFFKGKESTITQLKSKYEKMIADGDANGATKQELTEVKTKLEELQKKEAIYSEYEKEDYKGKYINLQNELNTQKEQNAFNSVRPSFSDKLNKYEVAAKWDEFMNNVKKTYSIEFDENRKPIAVDKENKFKIIPLDKLVNDDLGIIELMKAQSGGQGAGTGSAKMVKMDGIPFDLPANPTPEQKTEAVRKHLETIGIVGKTHKDYAVKFGEWMTKINESIKKA